MKKYIVRVKEIWFTEEVVSASSPEEAIQLVQAGHGEEIDVHEYVTTMDTDVWDVVDPETGDHLL